MNREKRVVFFDIPSPHKTKKKLSFTGKRQRLALLNLNYGFFVSLYPLNYSLHLLLKLKSVSRQEYLIFYINDHYKFVVWVVRKFNIYSQGKLNRQELHRVRSMFWEYLFKYFTFILSDNFGEESDCINARVCELYESKQEKLLGRFLQLKRERCSPSDEKVVLLAPPSFVRSESSQSLDNFFASALFLVGRESKKIPIWKFYFDILHKLVKESNNNFYSFLSSSPRCKLQDNHYHNMFLDVSTRVLIVRHFPTLEKTSFHKKVAGFFVASPLLSDGFYQKNKEEQDLSKVKGDQGLETGDFMFLNLQSLIEFFIFFAKSLNHGNLLDKFTNKNAAKSRNVKTCGHQNFFLLDTIEHFIQYDVDIFNYLFKTSQDVYLLSTDRRFYVYDFKKVNSFFRTPAIDTYFPSLMKKEVLCNPHCLMLCPLYVESRPGIFKTLTFLRKSVYISYDASSCFLPLQNCGLKENKGQVKDLGMAFSGDCCVNMLLSSDCSEHNTFCSRFVKDLHFLKENQGDFAHNFTANSIETKMCNLNLTSVLQDVFGGSKKSLEKIKEEKNVFFSDCNPYDLERHVGRVFFKMYESGLRRIPCLHVRRLERSQNLQHTSLFVKLNLEQGSKGMLACYLVDL